MQFLLGGYMNHLLLLVLPLFALATERVRPPEQLLREGYLPVVPSVSAEKAPLPLRHSLPWPVRFQDESHTIGNSMAQFQPFDNPPYFHGGCDLRTKAGEQIITPVGGTLEAGHYSYSTNPDGSMTKYWKPWPQSGSATYFEVAVVDASGIRYEFHHVSRSSLPPSIVAQLDSPNPRVEAGTYLGNVIRWMGGDYHHVHYNVILPNGTRVNPEYVSQLLPDNLSPELKSVYAIDARGNSSLVSDGQNVQGVKEFVARVIDRQDGNVYEHPPVYAAIQFLSGEKFEWDFRQTLTKEGGFPVLNQFFLASLTDPRGGRQRTEGGYGTGQSLIRLPVPQGARGLFEIQIGDMAGNLSIMRGSLLP